VAALEPFTVGVSRLVAFGELDDFLGVILETAQCNE
jgi:hypothetical protein